MRHPIVFVSGLGSWGDMLPLAALAKRLTEKNAHVIVFWDPSAKDVFAQSGATFVPVGDRQEPSKLLSDDPRYARPVSGMRLAIQNIFGPFSEASYAAATKIAERHPPSVCVSHFSTLGTVWLAKQRQIPSAVVHFAPASVMSVADPAALGPQELLPLSFRRALLKVTLPMASRGGAKLYAPFAAGAGVAGMEATMFADTQCPDLLVGMWSRRFRGRADDDPPSMHIAGFPKVEPPSLPMGNATRTFLDDGEPPIAFGLGSTGGAIGDRFFVTAVEVCQRLGRRAILVTGPDVPKSLPSCALAIPSVPYHDLLPRCAAFVHHGGIGTTAAALCSGKASVVTPIAFDQFDNAARARRLGVASVVPFKRATTSKLSRALQSVLAEGVQARAIDLAQQLAVEPDGAVEAAEAILRLASSSRQRAL